MGSGEIPVALPWLTFAAAWIALAFAAALLHGIARGWLARRAAGERAALLLALALLPPVAAALAAVLGFAPLIGGLLVDRHCHADGCWPHVPTLHAGAAYAVPLAVLPLLATVVAAWLVAGRLRRSLSLAALLGRVAERREREPFELIDTPERLACCVGLLRPRVLVSRGLLEMLTPAQLEIVVAHERAHAERRDNLRQLLAALCLWPVPRTWRQPLLAELGLASELACDSIAADAVGGARPVADTLRALERTYAPRPSPALDSLAERLVALEAPAPAGGEGSAVSAVIVAGYAATALGLTSLAHHGVEWLLAALG